MTEPRPTRALAALALTLATLAAAPPAVALVTYPGAAPCDGTLQACIDGVAAGETVEIATATPIMESLTIGKDLTLRSAPGVTGTLLADAPGQGTVVLSDAAGTATVRLEGLRFVRTTVAILGFADGSDFAVTGCSFIDDGGDDPAIDARLAATLSLLVERNELEWTGPTMLFRTSGNSDLDLVDIVVRANSMTSNTSGPILGPSASGVTVEAIGQADVQLRFESNLLVDLSAGGGGPAGLAVLQVLGFPLPPFGVPPVNAEIFNNTFHELAGGPALRLEGPPLTPIGSPAGTLLAVVYNNILSRNSAEPVLISAPLDNIIFRNNLNDLFANGAPPDLGMETLGAMTFDVDPLYVDEAGGDLRLSELSPLIDQGVDELPNLPPLPPIVLGPIDVTGGPRIVGPAPDLGAYEGPPVVGGPVAIPTLDRLGLLLLAGLLAAGAAWKLRQVA